MLLRAVIAPPPEVLATVALVVQSVEGVSEPTPERQPPSRFLRRRAKEPEPVPQPDVRHELDLVPVAAMSLPIAGFGNVTSADADRLAACLREAAAAWPPATVYFAGGGALEFADDLSVWARLQGDVDNLVAVADGVVRSVAARGFFLDRRRFRPALSVATITDTTTAPHLERVVAALEAFRGEPWSVEWVSVTKPSFAPDPRGSTEVYRIPLAAR